MAIRTTAPGPKVSFRQVTKRYGQVRAVDRIDLDINHGELFVLMGPSGSGKTTLLRMVNRMIEPDEGMVLVGGRDVREFDPVFLRRSIGYVIQQIGLFPHLTIAENIGLIPSLSHLPKEEIRMRTIQLLNLVQMDPESFMNRYPHELSGGQQQRVGLARALSMDPEILLMDEPFGALDPVLRRQLQREFLNIRRKLDKTIIFVTHDVDEAFHLGDRIGVMSEGRMIQVGTPEDLILNPATESVSNLINAEKKLRFLEYISARSLAIPIDPDLILIKSSTARDAISRLKVKSPYYFCADDGGDVEGIVYLQDILDRMESDTLLEEIMHPCLMVRSTMNAIETLRTMRDSSVTLAIVRDEKGDQGVIIMDEAVKRLL